MQEKFMRRCLELAEKGLGLVSPNPLVGSVIVKDDRIIAEGYHFRYGGPHAERVAISRVADPSMLSGSTLYVNLEPCNHFGKTPPCSELIIASGIPKVVIGARDPNPLVSGSGIARLRAAGIEVTVNVLEQESRELNRRFNTWIEKGRPYIILKWAETSDGFLDKEREPQDTALINWITSPALRSLVHRWRSEEDAILVGANTLIRDNPQLTVRNWHGRNPLRLTMENRGQVPANLHFFDNSASSVVFSNKEAQADSPDVEWVQLEAGNISEMLAQLCHRGITSLIVEGGAHTLKRFIDAGLWDEARIFTGAVRFKSGVRAPELPRTNAKSIPFGAEKLEIIRNK